MCFIYREDLERALSLWDINENFKTIGQFVECIQDGGSDDPFKYILSISKLNIEGLGSTNATFSQKNTDILGNDTFQVRDDGCVKIGGGSFGHPANTRFQVNNGSTGVLRLDTITIYVPNTISTINNSVLTIEGNSSGLVLQPINGNLGTVNIGGGKVNTVSYSSQTKKLLQLNQGWTSVAPSLDLTINALELNNAINMTNGTGTKIFRGIYHNPTITGVTDHRAFQSSSGGGYFNTTLVNDSAILQADSTTKGFLPPRMTTVQKNGIVAPTAGLIVYDTDLAKLCVFTTEWETITSL